MVSEDLTRPLGLPPKRKQRQRRPYFIGAALVVAVAAVGAAAWLFMPGAHGPTATAMIVTPPPGVAVSPERTGSTTAGPGTGGSGLSEVAPDGGLTDVGKVVIHDPSEPQPIQLASAPRADLIQKTADGMLPRVGTDGTRPLDAYARPSTVDSHDIRIAIVIGGFGIDPASTTQAIGTLPGAVTLAFAPYGKGLPKLVADARAAGHELLLQIPLEPYS